MNNEPGFNSCIEIYHKPRALGCRGEEFLGKEFLALRVARPWNESPEQLWLPWTPGSARLGTGTWHWGDFRSLPAQTSLGLWGSEIPPVKTNNQP